jgi:O-6-methylguanine DNA methyltransferase
MSSTIHERQKIKSQRITRQILIGGCLDYKNNMLKESLLTSINTSLMKSHKERCELKIAWIKTPLEDMIAIADETSLYMLEFADRPGLSRTVNKLCADKKCLLRLDTSPPLQQIESELHDYFKGCLKEFKTPLLPTGSLFQKHVWSELLRIPYGKTKSYAEQANNIGRKTAYRAVANANGVNKIVIVIPCHRIINSNGKLGGYGGGIHRKKWLIEHEQQYCA